MTNLLGCRMTSLIGTGWAASSLVIASFANSIDMLIIFMGASTGLALGFMYLPSIVIVSLWFNKKRGIATGIAVTGSGVGMFVVAPLAQLMIDYWGWRNSLYGLAGLVVLFGSLAILYRPVPADYRNKNIDSNALNSADRASTPSRSHVDSELKEQDLSEQNSQHSDQQSSDRAGTLPKTESIAGSEKASQANLSNKSKDRTSLAESKTQLRNRGKMSHASSFLSVSASEEPLKKKDIFYSKSSLNLSQENQNGSVVQDSIVKNEEMENPEKLEEGRCEKFKRGLRKMLGLKIFKDWCYILLLISTAVCFLGYFVPFAYLNAHAGVYGISETDAAFLNSIIGIANCIGRPISGVVVSHNVLSGVTMMNWSVIFGGTFTICLPFLQVYWALCIYAVLLGFAGAATGCTKSLAIVELMGLDRLTNALGYCYLLAGIAAITGPPVLGLAYIPESNHYLIVFIAAGSLLVLGGLSGLPLKKLSDMEKRKRKGQGKTEEPEDEEEEKEDKEMLDDGELIAEDVVEVAGTTEGQNVANENADQNQETMSEIKNQ